MRQDSVGKRRSVAELSNVSNSTLYSEMYGQYSVASQCRLCYDPTEKPFDTLAASDWLI